MSFLKRLLGPRKHHVRIAPADVSFDVLSGQSVLESALAEGVAFPHSCTVGTCGACKCRLLEGKVREISNFAYVLSADELRQGVILACQAAPQGNLVLEVEGVGAKRLHPPAQFNGRITATQKLTPDICRLTVHLDRPMPFDAGQFATLEVEGIHGARAYSMANPPEGDDPSALQFIIRLVPEGEFTTALFAGKLEGQRFKVHGPSGNFWLRESRAPLIAVAGGSGLAPLLSMLGAAAKRQVGRSCMVFFGARTQADLYAMDELAELARLWNGSFQFVPTLSHELEDSSWGGARGLVTTALESWISRAGVAGAEAYLCGPPAMVDAASAMLAAHGLDSTHIHFDKFLDGSHGLKRQTHD